MTGNLFRRLARRFLSAVPVAVRCRETSELPPNADELFRKVFRVAGPVAGRHFILECVEPTTQGCTQLLGYVNFRAHKTGYLAGGLVVDAWRYRNLDRHVQAEIKRHGGMAEWLMRHAVRAVAPCTAVYAYIGDKASETVNARVGFRRTATPYLFVLSESAANAQLELDALTESVASLGPF